MLEIVQRNSEDIRVELDVQITTAKSYPRSVSKSINEAIEMATLNKQTAESCVYSRSRGKGVDKKEITGESIRLAEILLSAWGNTHAASRIIENDGSTITVEGVAWDLEKNVKVCKQVKRSIKTKEGHTFGNDMQVVTANAAQSIALRNAILSVIPRSYAKEVFKNAVNFSIGIVEDEENLKEKIKSRTEKLILKFEEIGIKRSKIFNYFGYTSMDDFTRDDCVEMTGIGTRIKDKDLSLEKAFEFDDKNSEIKEKSEILNKKLEEDKSA